MRSYIISIRSISYSYNQPASTPKINWSNPLTRGLVLAVIPNSQVNAVTGLPFLVNSSSSYKTTGSSVGLISDLGYVSAKEPSSFGQPGSEFDLVSDITCLYYGFQSSTQNASDTFSRGQGSATISGWAIGLHGGSSNGAYAMYAGTALSPTGIFANVTKPTVSVLTAGSGTASLYCNGILQQSSAVGTPTYQYSPGSVRCVIFGSTTGMLNPSNNKSLLGLLWNRKLTVDEIRDISSNPWQIFESELRCDPIGITVIPSVPNLSLAQLINVLSTSAQPKVTLTF